MGYSYPSEFPAAARARVAAKRIGAAREFEERKLHLRWAPEVEAALRTCILQVFLSFAEGALELGRQGVWSVDQVEEQAGAFLSWIAGELLVERGVDRDGHSLRDLFDHWGGGLLVEVQREFEESPEWKRFTAGLLEVAARQAGASHSASRPDTGSSQSADPSAATDGVAAPTGPDTVEGGRRVTPRLNVDLIDEWMLNEGYTSDLLARRLKVSLRTVTSLRRNQKYHGRKAVQKLANLMGCDVVDLYLT